MKLNKICKFCKKRTGRETSEYCGQNCYQKWRYHNIKQVREKTKEWVKQATKRRYATDSEYRKQANAYSRAWQIKHTARVREIALKSYHKLKKMKRK